MATLEERAAALEEMTDGVVAPGKWATISFVVPDKLQEVREKINDFFELMNIALEIVNLALEFAKAFLSSYLDPIDAILKAIVDELKALAEDIRQLGIYITHDVALFNDWPPEDLKGGFSAYERRMVARLTDRTDPTRPDASSKMSVFALFIYLSVDPTDIIRLYEAIMTVVGLFTGKGKKTQRFSLPVPVIREVFYGNDAVSVFTPKTITDALSDFDGEPPNRFRIVWQVNPGANYPFNPFSDIAPAGFIVTVSTRRDGLALQYARPKKDDSDDEDKSGDKSQPREYGAVLDSTGEQAVLHGGSVMLDFNDKQLDFNNAVEAKQWKEGVSAVYGLPDPASPEIIPLAELCKEGASEDLGKPFDGKGEDYYIQRAFMVDNTGVAFEWATGSFSFALGKDDLPQQVRIEKQPDGTMKVIPDGLASTYYVRVAALPKIPNGTADYKLNVLDTPENRYKQGQPWVVPAPQVGGYSEPQLVSVAGEHSHDFLKLLRMSIKLLLLVRADLPHIDTHDKADEIEQAKAGKVMVEGKVLQLCGMESNLPLLQQMFPDGYDKWVEKVDSSPGAFMSALDDLADVWATRIYDQIGSNPQLEKAIYDGTSTMREMKARDLFHATVSEGLEDTPNRVPEDLTVMDFLEKGIKNEGRMGIARNPWSLGLEPAMVEDLRWTDAWPSGSGHFTEVSRGGLPVVPGEETLTYTTTSKQETERVLLQLAPSLQSLMRGYVQEDGTLKVPDEVRVPLDVMAASGATYTSADRSPVFWLVRENLNDMQMLRLLTRPIGSGSEHSGVLGSGSMSFARNTLAFLEGGALLREANFVLTGATGALTRPLADGEWIAIRAFDAFPELEDFFDALGDWLDAIQKAIKSAADAVIAYIEFVQAQIARLQQLLRMINALIQSLLNLVITLPRLSALGLLSSGTDGVVADLMNAQEKPYDSPLAYGAGVAVVIPFAPTFLVDLFMLLADSGDETTSLGPPTTVGREDAAPGEEAPAEDGDPL
jgi:hypothetical protein